MPEIFPHTLGGGLEIWASRCYRIFLRKRFEHVNAVKSVYMLEVMRIWVRVGR